MVSPTSRSAPSQFSPSVRDELDRQLLMQDSDFLETGLFFFVLKRPKRSDVIVPLALSPESEVYSEPFALTTTPTLNAGIFGEENGIISRRITITGTMGLRPKSFPAVAYGDASYASRFPSFARSGEWPSRAPGLDYIGTDAETAISGPLHHQLLQDLIFRQYADLKRNPRTAKGTELYFHVTRDREHWRVFPELFETRRDAVSSRTFFRYNIQLLAVDPAKPRGRRRTEGDPNNAGAMASIFASDTAAKLNIAKEAAAKAAAAETFWRKVVNSLASARDQVKKWVAKTDKAMQAVRDVVTDVQRAIQDGITVLTFPLTFVRRLAEDLDNIIEDACSFIASLDNQVLGALRDTVRALDQLLSVPEAFAPTADPFGDGWRALKFQFDQTSANKRVAASEVLAAANLTGAQTSANGLTGVASLDATTVAALRAAGTGPSLNEALRSLRSQGVAASIATPTAGTAFRSVTADETDTLQSIAFRELGDRGRWLEIALLNRLAPPYISSAGLPGTVRPGDVLLLPDTESTATREFPATQGTDASDPFEERLLGVGYALRDVSDITGSPQYDFEVDGSGADFRMVRGRDNLTQDLRTIVETERGTLAVLPDFGLSVAPGGVSGPIELALLQVEAVHAIESDPRIRATRRLTVDKQLDAIYLDFDAVIEGLETPLPISTSLR